MEDQQERLPQDRWYWGWFAIFGLLAGFTPFIPSPYSVPCGVIGFGGLLIQMREGFLTRMSRLKQLRISQTQILALVRIAAVVMLGILGIRTISLVFEMKNAMDDYVIPRTLTKDQASDLKKQLSAHTSEVPVIVAVSQADPEAIEYAEQIANTISSGGWQSSIREVNPWNGDNLKTTNMPNIYLALDRGLVLRMCQAPPDQKHPTPEELIRGSFSAAHVNFTGGGGLPVCETFEIIIEVGRRPTIVGREPSMLFKLGRWIEEFGQ